MSKPTKDLGQGQDDLPKKESRWCSKRHVHANVSFEQAAISCQRGSAPKTGFILQEKQSHIKLAFGFRIAFQHHREKKTIAARKEKREEEWGGAEGLLALLPYPSGAAWCARCWLRCPRAGSPWTRRFRDRGYRWQHRAWWPCGPFPPPSAAGPCQWSGSRQGGGLLQEEETHKVKEKRLGYGCSDSSAMV